MYVYSTPSRAFYFLDLNFPILSVLNPDDHRKTIVHQVIRAIRDYVGIEPEKYLQYLMRRSIEPSPELLKQIRGKDSRYEQLNYCVRLSLSIYIMVRVCITQLLNLLTFDNLYCSTRSRSPGLETSMHSVYTARSADSASLPTQPKTAILIIDGI